MHIQQLFKTKKRYCAVLHSTDKEQVRYVIAATPLSIHFKSRARPHL